MSRFTQDNNSTDDDDEEEGEDDDTLSEEEKDRYSTAAGKILERVEQGDTPPIHQ